MSRNVGFVKFEDDTRLYFVYNGTIDKAHRPLFTTQEEAWDSYVNKVIITEPPNAKATEEEVDLFTDIALSEDDKYSYVSKASRKVMWITGPTCFEEQFDNQNF